MSELTTQLPRSLRQLLEGQHSTFHQEAAALSMLLRQLCLNWYTVPKSGDNGGYPLTISVNQLLTNAELTADDIAYVQRVIAHVDTSGFSLCETDPTRASTFQDEAETNAERAQLRWIFQSLGTSPTLEMANLLAGKLPSAAQKGYTLRPCHMPSLQILHLLLLRCGFWPKMLIDECLNVAEAGYDPVHVPEVNEATLTKAASHREFTDKRPKLHDITTFNNGEELRDGEYEFQLLMAVATLSSLANDGLAVFNNAYVEKYKTV